MHSAKVENAVSDRDSRRFRSGPRAASPKNSKGQILNREIRTGNVCGFNPTLRFGIVGLVEDGFHSRYADEP